MGIIVAIVIVLAFGYHVILFIETLHLGKKRIRCDGCGEDCYVRSDEYKKDEHEAGLIGYYCGKCRRRE